MKSKLSIENIYTNYQENLTSISYYFSRFGELAEGEDESLKKETADVMSELLGEWGIDEQSLHTIEESQEKPKFEIRLTENSVLVLRKLMDRQSKISIKNFDILSKSSFLMLNNYFEYLISDLLSYYYICFQKSLNEKEFKVTLKEVNEYESIEEFTNSLVLKEIETMIIENSFDKLLEHFEIKLKISLEKEIINWDLIKEYRERRHIIVHNSSIVNKKYLSRTGNPYHLKIGDVVEINREYFVNSLQNFQLAGFLLIFDCWGNWEKATIDKSIEKMMYQSFEFLKSNLNESAKGICNFCDKIIAKNEVQEEYLLKILINKCIALKRTDNKVQLKKELSKIKVGTSTPIFKLAYQILNDDDKNLIENFKNAIKLNEISERMYLEWPIFEFLRNREQLNEEIMQMFI